MGSERGHGAAFSLGPRMCYCEQVGPETTQKPVLEWSAQHGLNSGSVRQTVRKPGAGLALSLSDSESSN